MRILVTGAAGFIGFHLVSSLLKQGLVVVGLDNINDYYSTKLKYSRLKETGIRQEEVVNNKIVQSHNYSNYTFIKTDLTDQATLKDLFETHKFSTVVHLAAQAGVRHSITNPRAYIQSNILGYYNILELCREHAVDHLIYASSSSIYGNSKSELLKEIDQVDNPISLYAASKKSNELMAHTYSHLYNLKTTGLRFFTVYGPWGRPDMAYYLFINAITNNKPIKVFNEGKLQRDFTFIDDIIAGIELIIGDNSLERTEKYKVYNIGNNSPVNLLDFIQEIESVVGKKADKVWMPMQAGDVESTYADVTALQKDYGYRPKTSITEGIRKFYNWYEQYHKTVEE